MPWHWLDPARRDGRDERGAVRARRAPFFQLDRPPPGRAFFFSAHSLNVFSFRFGPPAVSWTMSLRALLFRGGAMRLHVHLRLANRSIDVPAARARGWELEDMT